MADVTGTRRVRMVGAEHWTDNPEQELLAVAIGGDTYAVHERIAVDTARVRLYLRDDEDAEAAVRELPGQLVRDIRVFLLIEPGDGSDVADGLLAWRLALPVDDPATGGFDELPALLDRLAGAAAALAVVEAAAEPVVEPAAAEAVEAVAAEDEPLAVVEDAAPLALVEDDAPLADVVALPVVEEPVAEEHHLLAPVLAVVPHGDEPVLPEALQHEMFLPEPLEDVAPVEDVPLLAPVDDEPVPDADVVPLLAPVDDVVDSMDTVDEVPVLAPVDDVVVEPVVLEPVAEPVDEAVVEDLVDDVPALAPAEDVPVLAELAVLSELAADEPEVAQVEAVEEVSAVEERAPLDVVEAEEIWEVAPLESVDPFALPAEHAFPLEADESAVEAVEDDVVDVLPEPEIVESVVDADVEVPEAPEAVEAVEPVIDVVDEPAAEAEVVDAVVEEADAEVAETDAVEAVEAVDAVDTVGEEPVGEEPVVDPRDAAWAGVGLVVAGPTPACSAHDRDDVCAVPAEVVWQSPAGVAWSCAWHWPSTMSGHVHAEVGAVRHPGGWATWRDGDGVALARQAADLFADAARGFDKPVARPLVALDALDDMLRRLPEDVRGAVLLWAIAVTNPEWDVDAVAAHGRAALEHAQALGRAIAWPDELYFQEQAAPAPIVSELAEGEEPEPPAIDGDRLFAEGNMLAAAGDLRGAAKSWAEAAEGADHALAMRALGDLARSRDDLKTAEEWYGRAAFLNEPTSMTRIGVIYVQKGQPERAGEWLRRAERFGDAEATTHLQELAGASV
jgi:hypothetical protein